MSEVRCFGKGRYRGHSSRCWGMDGHYWGSHFPHEQDPPECPCCGEQGYEDADDCSFCADEGHGQHRPCWYCGALLHIDRDVWVDNTDGDYCPSDEERENQLHVPEETRKGISRDLASG